jgi:hypothetical protein
MNLWKVSTITLAATMTILVGRDAFTKADAATNGTDRPGAVTFDWGMEQPHMQKALDDLKGARHSLEVAAENKGGWRVLALKHTDDAIAETVRGMEWGRNHPHE